MHVETSILAPMAFRFVCTFCNCRGGQPLLY